MEWAVVTCVKPRELPVLCLDQNLKFVCQTWNRPICNDRKCKIPQLNYEKDSTTVLLAGQWRSDKLRHYGQLFLHGIISVPEQGSRLS